MPTHYETLGLKTGAAPSEVKTAYRRLARQLHPDVNPEPDANERFQAVQRAYEALSDPKRKAAYDAILAAEAERHRKLTREEKDRREAEELRLKAEAMMREGTVRPASDAVREGELRALMATGRLLEAETLARRMIETEPRQPVPHAVLGDIHRMRGEFDKAILEYGYAAQYEPNDPTYQRRYEELLSARSASARRFDDTYVPEVALQPLGVAVFVTVALAVYVGLSPERPLGLLFAPKWTLGLVVSAFVGGVVWGACLSLSQAVARYAVVAGSAVARVSPLTLVALLSLLSFWLAGLVYFVIGQTQHAFNRSVSLALGTVIGVTVVLALGCWAKGADMAGQTLAWAGSLVLFGHLAGWAVADQFQTSR